MKNFLSPPKPFFVSIKWKALILISLLLIATTSSFCWLNHVALLNQFQKRQSLTRATNRRAAQALLRQTFEKLERLTGTIPSLSGISEALHSADPEKLKTAFDAHWPILQIDNGIEIVKFYSVEKQLLASWGGEESETLPDIAPQWIKKTIEDEQPVSALDCTEKCLAYTAIPLLSQGEISGGALLGVSLADMVLDLREISGADIALATAGPGAVKAEKSPERILHPWAARIVALTAAPGNAEAIKSLAAMYSLEQLKDGVQCQIGNVNYGADVASLTDLHADVWGEGFLIVLSDTTEAIKAIRTTDSLNFQLGAAGLAVAEAMLLFLLWTPMKRLRAAADNLPLLAHGEFEKVRSLTAKSRAFHRINDEVDVLAATTISLSNQLERLTRQVAERSRVLEIRMEELARERDFVESLLDTAQLVIFTQDSEGIIKTANQYAEFLTGLSKRELVGKNLAELAGRDNCLQDLIRENQKENPPRHNQLSCEGILKSKDGGVHEVTWFHTGVSGREAGSDTLILTLGLDLTERKQAERSLKTSEERFRVLVENAADAFFLYSSKGKILQVNKEACAILEYSRPELLRLSIEDISEGYDEKTLNALAARLQNEGAVTISEDNLIKKDKSTVPVEVRLSMLHEGDQKLTLALARDIRQRKILEENLRQSQKMEAIGRLAGGIAHDFNNILSAIFGYTELTILNLAEGTARSNLDQVMIAANRAKELVKQILTFSRKAPEKREFVNIREVVEEAMKLITASIPKTIEIRANLSSDSGVVLADPTQLHQVVMNLCTNAYQSMQDKEGGVLEVSLAPLGSGLLAAQDIFDAHKKQYVQLMVKDSGEGMDKVTASRVFEPYFTTKKPGEGTGMGLAVVHGIVKSHGGSIKIDSNPGKGTAIYVYLPKQLLGKNLNESSADSFTGGTERILFVDDEPALADLGGKLLQSLGYAVTATSSSIEALKKFQLTPLEFDIVVTDQIMPGLTGTMLAKELLSIRPDIPIIICTGYSEMVDEQNAKKLGVSDFLMKPIIMKELFSCIRKALDERKEIKPGNI